MAVREKEKEMKEEMTLKLLKLGVPMEDISKATGLTAAEIKKLKSTRKNKRSNK